MIFAKILRNIRIIYSNEYLQYYIGDFLTYYTNFLLDFVIWVTRLFFYNS